MRALLVALVLVLSAGIPAALVLSTPCATEDSANCVWHAGTAGNGIGASFVDLAGTAYYF